MAYGAHVVRDGWLIVLPAKEKIMLRTEDTISTHSKGDDVFDRTFKPKGAIAFFILLCILGLIIWYGIYFLMLARI